MTQILFPTDTTGVTPASGDIILIADVSDSNNPKDCTLAELPISTVTQTALDAKQDTLTGLTASVAELNYTDGVTSAIQTQIDSKSPIASPTFTGTVSGITAVMVGAPSGSGTSSGTNTGDQTITLTGAVTGTGTGSFATTIATPGTVTVSSTNSTATAHTHAVTSSPAPGAAASLLATDASGHIGSTGTRIVKGWFTDITATNAISGSVTGNAGTVTTNANLTGAVTSTGNATLLGSFTTAQLNTALSDNDIATGGGTATGTNTGDQTSIVGITGTMAQFDTAVTDGNIVYQSQALGTPTSGTLTNCTGLPLAGVVDSTTEALGVGSLEVGHASDTTISRVSAGVIAVEGVTVPTISSTSTETNKTMTGTTNILTARLLKSATTEIDVSAATAPSSGQVLTATSSTTATWQTPSGGSFSWGASVSAGTGVGLTMTSADLSGANAFQSSTHTASGTLTACTTTQNTYSTSRTYTLTSGSVTDNFIGTLFSRTNVTTGAGGTLLAQGPVVNITGTDTQTAGTLTPSYNLLQLNPSLRSTGSSINVTVADSIVTAPTNGHIYAVLGNTQTVAQTLLKLDTGSSSISHTALNIETTRGVGIKINSTNTVQATASTAYGIQIGQTFNTNSAFNSFGIYAVNKANAGAGANGGIRIYNEAALADVNTVTGAGTGLSISQVGVNGTAFSIYSEDNVNCSTNGVVNYSMTNTQSGATVMQKIDLGTSAQGHTGLLVNMSNASSSVNGIKIDAGTAGTGRGLFVDSTGASNNLGSLFRHSVTSSSLSNRTNEVLSTTSLRTNTATTGTVADNYNAVQFYRSSTQNGAGGTLTTTGSVLKLENVATQTAGTLTDTVACLSLVQDNDSTGGHILFNTYTGVPLVDGTLYFNGTDLKIRAGGVTYTLTKT